jgi:hypothetical protein
MSSKTNAIHLINLAETEFVEISLTDRNGKEVAKIEFLRDVEATPQLQISYYDKDGNVTQSTTTYDVDA